MKPERSSLPGMETNSLELLSMKLYNILLKNSAEHLPR